MQITRETAEHIEAIVRYNWDDERDDYWNNCSDDPDGNQRSGHVFESLMVVQSYLEQEFGFPHKRTR